MGVSRGGRGRPGSCGQGMVSATNDQPLEQGHGCLDGPEKGGDTVPRGVELCYSASYVPHVLAMNPRAPLGTPILWHVLPYSLGVLMAVLPCWAVAGGGGACDSAPTNQCTPAPWPELSFLRWGCTPSQANLILLQVCCHCT